MKQILLLLILLFPLASHAQEKEIIYDDVDSWLTALQSPDLQVRNTAALAWPVPGADTALYFQELSKALHSEHAFVREYAAFALAQSGIYPKKAIPLIIGLFHDPIMKVREMAAIATTLYGHEATSYLLDTLVANKGRQSPELESIYEPGNSVKTSSAAWYAIVALRNIDSSVVAKAIACKGLNRAHRSLILDAYVPDFDGRSYAIGNGPAGSLYLFPADTLITHSFSPLSKYGAWPCVESMPDSLVALRDTLDTWFKNGDMSVLMNAYFRLAKNPSLIPGFLNYFRRDIGPDRFSLPALLCLRAAGSTASAIIPNLMVQLRNGDFLPEYQIIIYQTIGDILCNNRWEITGARNAGNSEIHDLMGLEREISDKPYFLHYRYNAGMTCSETDTSWVYNEMVSQGHSVASLKKADCIVSMQPLATETIELSNADTTTTAFLQWGMDHTMPELNTLALHYLCNLKELSPAQEHYIRNHINDSVAMVRDFALAAAESRNLDLPGIENLLAKRRLDRDLEALFSQTYHYIFNSEGWPLVGAIGASGGDIYFPQMPWPPATSSCTGLLSIDHFKQSHTTVQSFLNQLSAVLTNAGFSNDRYRYFGLPGGVALVTQLEQINPDGSVSTSNRWLRRAARNGNTLSTSFSGREGYFRSLCFVLCPNPNFTDNGGVFTTAIRFDDAFNLGGFVLPRQIQALPLKDMYVRVLVYEYYSKNGGVVRMLRKSESPVPVSQHLQSLGISNSTF